MGGTDHTPECGAHALRDGPLVFPRSTPRYKQTEMFAISANSITSPRLSASYTLFLG